MQNTCCSSRNQIHSLTHSLTRGFERTSNLCTPTHTHTHALRTLAHIPPTCSQNQASQPSKFYTLLLRKRIQQTNARAKTHTRAHTHTGNRARTPPLTAPHGQSHSHTHTQHTPARANNRRQRNEHTRSRGHQQRRSTSWRDHLVSVAAAASLRWTRPASQPASQATVVRVRARALTRPRALTLTSHRRACGTCVCPPTYVLASRRRARAPRVIALRGLLSAKRNAPASRSFYALLCGYLLMIVLGTGC